MSQKLQTIRLILTTFLTRSRLAALRNWSLHQDRTWSLQLFGSRWAWWRQQELCVFLLNCSYQEDLMSLLITISLLYKCTHTTQLEIPPEQAWISLWFTFPFWPIYSRFYLPHSNPPMDLSSRSLFIYQLLFAFVSSVTTTHSPFGYTLQFSNHMLLDVCFVQQVNPFYKLYNVQWWKWRFIKQL